MTIVLFQIFLHIEKRDLAFDSHSSSLLLPSQEMSLNIDIKRILSVKVSGASPNLLSRSVTLPQSCNVVNPVKICPLELGRLSIESVIVSVAFVGDDPFNPILSFQASLDFGC